MATLPLTFDLESPSWLQRLRWVAILGMAASIFAGVLWGMEIAWKPLAVILVLLSLWNLVLPQMEEHFSSAERYSFFQILVDLSVLTAVLWRTGGCLNPFVSFYVLHVMMGALLLNRKLTQWVALVASGFVVLLVLAPPVVVREQEVYLADSPIWIGIPIGLILLIFFTTFFSVAFLTRLRKFHKEKEQRQKMAALGRLVSGLAHEIGTPLNSILILSKDLQEAVPAELREDLRVIQEQTKRCGDLVSLLLGYSRGNGQGPGIRMLEIEWDEWLKEVFLSMSSSEDRRISLRSHVEGFSGKMKIPELVLRQVLGNVFKNALYAIRDLASPEIFVEVRPDADPAAKMLCITVQDNGVGFSQETKERAFEAFFTTKEPGDGVGLGLYISYYLLEQVGGRITIEDSLSPGAKIMIRLPYVEA